MKVPVVCAVVGFLGILSAALAFSAEARRRKASDVQGTGGECIYQKSPAFALGLAAAVALLMAQAIICTVAGCICCKRHRHFSGTNWTIGLISCIISWVVFVIAFLVLLASAALSGLHSDAIRALFEYCYVVKRGLFSVGAVLSLASVSLGIIWYFALSSSGHVDSRGAQQNQGIGLGQPQIPPESTSPMCVQEDTYNRQQLR